MVGLPQDMPKDDMAKAFTYLSQSSSKFMEDYPKACKDCILLTNKSSEKFGVVYKCRGKMLGGYITNLNERLDNCPLCWIDW